jgi:hypothetical protein
MIARHWRGWTAVHLRITPAMEAGLTNYVWNIGELLAGEGN